MALKIASPAFDDGRTVPRRYTCDGDDISPPLEWSGAPTGTKSVVLIVHDPDAPGRDWVHWVVFNLPPDSIGLAEGVGGNDLPAGTLEGLNDWKKPGYGGPCPPSGRHRYVFRLYALDCLLAGLTRPTKRDVEKAMQGHVLGQDELVGVYRRSDAD